jgi:hypothetical protein
VYIWTTRRRPKSGISDQVDHLIIPPKLETLYRAHFDPLVDWNRIPQPIVIAGTVYNCGAYLDAVFQNIQAIGRLFRRMYIFMAYDDSPDDSLDKLQQWQSRLPGLTILPGVKTSTRRTDNLTLARNRLLQAMRELYQTIAFEFFIVMDMDNVCSGPMHLPVLQSVLQQASHWDAVSFPGWNSYYDIWALAIDPYFFSYVHYENNRRALIRTKNYMLEQLTKGEWIPVHSAFGGFGIYKSQPFLKCSYANDFKQNLSFFTKEQIQRSEKILETRLMHPASDAVDVHGDCEHRYFHFTAKFKYDARMFVIPYALFELRDYDD